MLQLSIEHVVTHPLILDAAEHLVLCVVTVPESEYNTALKSSTIGIFNIT